MLVCLNQYEWSSYPAFVGTAPKPTWLFTNEIFRRSSFDKSIEAFRQFVESKRRSILEEYYDVRKLPSVLGSKDFKHYVSHLGFPTRIPSCHLEPSEIIEATAKFYDVHLNTLLTTLPGKPNTPRLVAMHLIKYHTKLSTEEIASCLATTHSNVTVSLSRTKQSFGRRGFEPVCQQIIESLSC